MPNLTLGGTDVSGSSYGFHVDAIEGWLDAAPLSAQELRVTGRPGVQTADHQVGPRPITVRGKLKGSSVADARSKLHNLKSLVTRTRPTTLVFGDETSVQTSAEYRAMRVAQLGALDALQFARLAVEIRFLAADPFLKATSQTTVSSITTSPTDLEQGTAPVWPQIRILGSATNPVLTLKDEGGSTVETMGFTISLGGSDYLCIDMDKQTAYQNTSGNFNEGTNVIDDWTSGNFFHVKPEYSDYVGSSWVTLEVSAGTATAIYTKAWY